MSEHDLSPEVVIVGTPWTLSRAVTFGERSDDPAVNLGIYGGGFDATWTLVERIQDRLHTGDAAAPGDLAALLVHVIGAVGYMRNDLAEPDLEGEAPGDPTGYLLEFGRARGVPPELEMTRRAPSVRRDALLNFADFDLVSVGLGFFRDYLWRGDRSSDMRGLVWGKYSFSPHVRFNLTPAGPEYQIASYVRWSDGVVRGYVRWAEPPTGDRMIGVGARYVRRTPGLVQPAATVDLWRNPAGGLGTRIEAAATINPGRGRWFLQASAGGKTRGYVLGLPLESGFLVGIGGGVRF